MPVSAVSLIVHAYVHGVAAQLDELALNVTAEPTTGEEGEYVNAATGGPGGPVVVKVESVPNVVPEPFVATRRK
jgi:hypothetical protein